MRCYYELGEYTNSIDAAMNVLELDKVQEEYIREANFRMAKSFHALDEMDFAKDFYRKVAREVNSVEGAESKYRGIEIRYENDDLDGAEKEIFEFIEESYQYGLRSVLIIHGKGESKADQARGSILKGCVDQWLRDLETVLAFHSAQPRDGGTGAAYVLLRKSEEKKRENREKFSKGRVASDPD